MFWQHNQVTTNSNQFTQLSDKTFSNWCEAMWSKPQPGGQTDRRIESQWDTECHWIPYSGHDVTNDAMDRIDSCEGHFNDSLNGSLTIGTVECSCMYMCMYVCVCIDHSIVFQVCGENCERLILWRRSLSSATTSPKAQLPRSGGRKLDRKTATTKSLMSGWERSDNYVATGKVR